MFFDRDFKEILSTQTISLIGGLLAGAIMAFWSGNLLLVPGLLVVFPGFLEMRGNISGSFSSRLSSGLFLKYISPSRPNRRVIAGNLMGSFFLAFLVSAVIGSIGVAFNYLVLGHLSFDILYIVLLAGVIANLIEIPLALFMTLYFFKRGHDPNNVMGPFITSTGDITSILSLMVAMVII